MIWQRLSNSWWPGNDVNVEEGEQRVLDDDEKSENARLALNQLRKENHIEELKPSLRRPLPKTKTKLKN